MNHLASAVRLASTLACGIVLMAFALWATDETKSVSTQQAAQADAAVNGSSMPEATPAVGPAVAEPEHDGIRGAIESANDTLVEPFDTVVQSTNDWVTHGVPMLLALLTYGLLARLLVAYMAPRG